MTTRQDTGDVRTCPLPGECPKPPNHPFSGPNGVVMHLINTPTHSTVTTKQEAYNLIQNNDNDNNENQTTTTREPDHDSNPAFDGPPNKPKPNTMSNSVELPCGHESFNPNDIPNSAIEDGQTSVTCDKCKKTWPVTDL